MMQTSTETADERKQWITAVCTGVLELAGEHPTLESAGFAPVLGGDDLLRALLVARAAAFVSTGHPTADVVRMLVDSGALVGPGVDPQRLDGLVSTVQRRMASTGSGSVGLFGCGLIDWCPESTYRLLLELWSAQRLGAVSSARVKRDLTRQWDVRDPAWVTACLSRSPNPLEEYASIWVALEDEPDLRVRSLVSTVWHSQAESERAVDRWTDPFLADASKAEHLLTIGVDRIQVEEALRLLRRLKDSPDPDFSKIIARAVEILDGHQKRVAATIDGLSTLERHLLRDRTEDERFQDECLADLLQWSCDLRFSSSTEGPDAAHGMRGPLPWWRIRVRSDDQVQAATATLAEGTRLLGLARDPALPDRVELICRRPRSGSPGLRAHFAFDLTSAAHAGELLLIGRRGAICVDLVAASDVDVDTHLGTLRVTAGAELSQMLTEIASKALAGLVNGPRIDRDSRGCSEFGELLRQGANGSARIDRWSADRDILVTTSTGFCGEVMVETTDPPTSLVRPRRPGTSAAPGIGFVYVQRNPAMPGMLKIGFSRRLSEDRANELFSTSVPFPFEVTHRALTMHAHKVEQAVHRLLDAHRVTPGREFFRVSQATADEAIRFCMERVTGIGSWEPTPTLHRLRAGDRVVLPLKIAQAFVVMAYPSVMAPTAEVLDVWQAHADGDVLELHVTADPGLVRGRSDRDHGAEEDPVPHLNRDGSAPNGLLIGRERLVAGDRLCWISEDVPVVFEIHSFCQVIYRSWDPQYDLETGIPLSLNDAARPLSQAAAAAVREVLKLGRPRTWAPRNPDPTSDWARAATRESKPEDWLPQLRQKQ